MKNCEQYHAEWIELARSGAVPGAAAERHLHSCADCRDFLETQMAVQESLRSIQREEALLDSGQSLHRASLKRKGLTATPRPMIGRIGSAGGLAAGFEPVSEDLEAWLLAEFDAAHAGNQRPMQWRWAAAVALAATLTLAVALVRQPPSPPRAADRPFLEIPYTTPLAPYERTRIVRMQVPVAALIAAGFEVHAADTGSALEADVLFGQDGRAHAIRPVTNSTQEN